MMATRDSMREPMIRLPMRSSSSPKAAVSLNTRDSSVPSCAMTAPWNRSQPPRDCFIWKNRTVSAPWATACQLSLRTSPGCLTLQNGNQFCWFGVCSISMNGLLPPMPRIRSWHMAVKLGGVSMPG